LRKPGTIRGGSGTSRKISGGTPCSGSLRSIRFCGQKDRGERDPGVVAIAATGLRSGLPGRVRKPRSFVQGHGRWTDGQLFWIVQTQSDTARGHAMVENRAALAGGAVGALLPDLAAPKVFEGFEAMRARLRPRPQPDPTLRSSADPYRRLSANDMWQRRLKWHIWKKTGTPGSPPERNGRAEGRDHVRSPARAGKTAPDIDFVGKAVEATSGVRPRCLSACPSVQARRHGDTGFKIGDHSCARMVARARPPPRGEDARCPDSVRARAATRIPHGRRRPLRHRRRLTTLHPADLNKRRGNDKQGAEAGDRVQ